MTQSASKIRRTYKQAKRSVRTVAAAASDRIAAVLPNAVKTRLGPPYRHFQMLLLDVGALRLVYPNRHKLAPGVWRSAQPLPRHIAALARQGLRTVVNLRGHHAAASYRIEREACRRAGIEMIDFEVRSRAAPTRDELHRIKALFDTITYPTLLHCKSGADRAGLMSVLYLHFRQGVAIKEARKQLSVRFGHIRHASPGVLTRFFDQYLEDTKQTGQDFMTWVDTTYDPDALQATFRSKNWANRLVDDFLSRE